MLKNDINLFNANKLHGLLINYYLGYVQYCNFSKLKGGDWVWILQELPYLSYYCNWNKLSGFDWSWLLRVKPQFAEHCDWYKLTSNDWYWLLLKQPQFEKYRKLDDRKKYRYI